MKEEITCAVEFLTKVLLKYCEPGTKVDKFQGILEANLTLKYKNHWFVDDVSKGQAYRCLRWNYFETEPLIEEAIKRSEIDLSNLPSEVTLWVDPSEVSCRFGEQRGFVQTVGKLVSGDFKSYVDEIDLSELERNSTRSPFSVSSDDGDSSLANNLSISPISKSTTSSVSSQSYSSVSVMQVEDRGTILKSTASSFYSPTAKKCLFPTQNNDKMTSLKSSSFYSDFSISSKFTSSQGLFNPYCLTTNYQIYKSADKKLNKSLLNNYPQKLIDTFG